MNKLKFFELFYGCCFGKYKIRSIIAHTDKEFDIVLEALNEYTYYSFAFSHKDGVLDDEFYTYRWDKKLCDSDYEVIDVEVIREELGHYVFDSVCNLATFILKNGFIK